MDPSLLQMDVWPIYCYFQTHMHLLSASIKPANGVRPTPHPPCCQLNPTQKSNTTCPTLVGPLSRELVVCLSLLTHLSA